MPAIKWFLMFGLVLITRVVSAQTQLFMDAFKVQQNPYGQNQIEVIATDTAGNINPGINDTYKFTINGFDEDLKFEQGTAFYHQKFDHSGFIYLKLNDVSGGCSALYYVYSTDSRLFPIRVNPWLLLVIPALLILIGYMFKRFITIAIVLFLVFIYFNHHSGLGITTFFATIFDSIKHLVTHGFK